MKLEACIYIWTLKVFPCSSRKLWRAKEHHSCCQFMWFSRILCFHVVYEISMHFLKIWAGIWHFMHITVQQDVDDFFFFLTGMRVISSASSYFKAILSLSVKCFSKNDTHHNCCLCWSFSPSLSRWCTSSCDIDLLAEVY